MTTSARTTSSTGKERDTESGLDYFGARYYGSWFARFSSADAPFADQHASNPQSWNLYSYVRNNSLNAVDPDGRGAKWVYRVWQVYKKSKGGTVVGEARNNRHAVERVKRHLDSIDQRQGNKRVVEAPTESARDKMVRQLDPNGQIRGPEQSGRYPEHVNPESGPYKDVHVQTTEAMKKAGFLGALASVFAAETQAAAQNPDSDAATVASAAAWDTASAIDPLFFTEIVQWLFGLSPPEEITQEREAPVAP